jgi:hypothetical protein
MQTDISLLFVTSKRSLQSLDQIPEGTPRLSKTLKHLSSLVVLRMGTVTLRGPVRTEDEKFSIQSKAKAIAGVDDVRNELIIVAKNGERFPVPKTLRRLAAHRFAPGRATAPRSQSIKRALGSILVMSSQLALQVCSVTIKLLSRLSG